MLRRSFLTGFGAVCVLGPVHATIPRTLDGELRRSSPDQVVLRWSGATGPIEVTATDDPASPLGAGRALTMLSQVDGETHLTLEAWPRTYLDIVDAQGASLRLGERLVPFYGGRNFRDVGGYRTSSGAATRWGAIYRSGAMTALTSDDLALLQRLGIKKAFDLRSVMERDREPSPLEALLGADYVTHAYDIPLESFRALVRAPTAEEARALAAEFYIEVATLLKPYMRELVTTLAQDSAPIVINCSAGKDRTGIVSALLLSALGVDRRIVLEDYGLSEVYLPLAEQLMLSRQSKTGAFAELESLRAEATHIGIMTMMGADPKVLDGALDLIDQRFGGPAEFLHCALDVPVSDIVRMRATRLG